MGKSSEWMCSFPLTRHPNRALMAKYNHVERRALRGRPAPRAPAHARRQAKVIYITVTETGRTRPHTASNSLVCQEATSSRIPIGFLVSYCTAPPTRAPRAGGWVSSFEFIPCRACAWVLVGWCFCCLLRVAARLATAFGSGWLRVPDKATAICRGIGLVI